MEEFVIPYYQDPEWNKKLSQIPSEFVSDSGEKIVKVAYYYFKKQDNVVVFGLIKEDMSLPDEWQVLEPTHTYCLKVLGKLNI